MNLVSEPWIPVVWRTGETRLASLQEAFEQADHIGDFVVQPYERIALMRLFLCIVQAALNGPENDLDWREARQKIQPAALQYLSRWQEVFDLFSAERPFLQAARLEAAVSKHRNGGVRSVPASKLNLRLATESMPTLWDTAGGTEREFSSAELALMLLAYQNFSPCGTIGAGFWNGHPTLGWKSYPRVGPGFSSHAPCSAGNMLHAFIRCRSLLETIQGNMLTKELVDEVFGPRSWGRPLWELMPESPEDSPAARNATGTYLGRLVPLSRAVKLHEDHRSITLANGLVYPEFPVWREPSASVIIATIRGAEVPMLLSASTEKAVWRELHSVLAGDTAPRTRHAEGPLILRHLPEDAPFDLWTGGLICDKAKIKDTVEATYHVAGGSLRHSQRRVYEAGIAYADEMAGRLHRANYVYHLGLGDSLDRSDMSKRRQDLRRRIELPYWTALEQWLPALLTMVSSAAQSPDDWSKTPWGQHTYRTAVKVYEHSCPLSSARQAKAHVSGMRQFYPPPILKLKAASI